jgi:hypothetical protein
MRYANYAVSRVFGDAAIHARMAGIPYLLVAFC